MPSPKLRVDTRMALGLPLRTQDFYLRGDYDYWIHEFGNKGRFRSLPESYVSNLANQVGTRMDTAHIPKSFWHSLSFCMIIATLGLLYIAHLSSTVSIQIANAKIELSSAINKTKELKGDLESENERLKTANTQLESKLSVLEHSVGDNARAKAAVEELRESMLGGPNSKLTFRKPTWFRSIDKKILSAERAVLK